jgi:copper resistance protein C
LPSIKRGVDKRVRNAMCIGWMLLLLLVPLTLWAHAQQEGTYPEDGATVEGTPEKIGIWFDHRMRLVLFEVSGPDGRVDLSASPGRDSVDRFEAAPAGTMAPGEYTVRWRGLAEDGHVMFDEFYFTVR